MSATPRDLRTVLNGERRGFITPITLPMLLGTEEVAAFHRAKVVRRRRWMIGIAVAILASVACLLFGSCS